MDPFRGAEIKSEFSDIKAEDPFAADVTGKNFLLPYEKENEVYAKNHLIMSEAFKETVIVVENVENGNFYYNFYLVFFLRSN